VSRHGNNRGFRFPNYFDGSYDAYYLQSPVVNNSSVASNPAWRLFRISTSCASRHLSPRYSNAITPALPERIVLKISMLLQQNGCQQKAEDGPEATGSAITWLFKHGQLCVN
jgi:hypothetical protein